MSAELKERSLAHETRALLQTAIQFKGSVSFACAGQEEHTYCKQTCFHTVRMVKEIVNLKRLQGHLHTILELLET
jgi:hypothetical protein